MPFDSVNNKAIQISKATDGKLLKAVKQIHKDLGFKPASRDAIIDFLVSRYLKEQT